MLTLKQRIAFASALVLLLLSTTAAQETRTATQSSSLTITAAAASEGVRITAPASVLRMHVEVYSTGGEKLFDQAEQSYFKFLIPKGKDETRCP